MPDITLTNIQIIPDNQITTIISTSTLTITETASLNEWYVKVDKRQFSSAVSLLKNASTSFSTSQMAVPSSTSSATTSLLSSKASSSTSSGVLASYFDAPEKDTSKATLILAISIPIGVIFLGLLFLSIWYLYFKKRHEREIEETEMNYYNPAGMFGNSKKEDYKYTRENPFLSSFKKAKDIIQNNSPTYDSEKYDIYNNRYLTQDESFSSSNDDETYRERDFGPVKVNKVSTPSNRIKSWFNRKSVQILYSKTSDEDLNPPSSNGSLSTLEGLQLPQKPFKAYHRYSLKTSPYFLKPFKLLGGISNNNSSCSLITNSKTMEEENKENILLPRFVHDDEYEYSNQYDSPPQVLQSDYKKQVPILGDPKEIKRNGSPKPLYSIKEDGTYTPPSKGTFCFDSELNNRTTPITPINILQDDSAKSRGTVIMRDELYIVMRSYKKVLIDELNLDIGELCCILRKHDDGWCLIDKVSGYKTNGERGMVPVVCIKKLF